MAVWVLGRRVDGEDGKNDHLKYEVTRVRRFVFRSVVVGKL